MSSKIVGFNLEIAQKANAVKDAEKKERQRKDSTRKNSLHIRFNKGASLDNKPFAGLRGLK